MEQKAGCGFGASVIEVGNGVDQSSDPCTNRESAIAHGAQLCQTARLKSRRDQDGVDAGLHKMGQILVIAENAPDVRPMRSRKRRKAVLELAVAGSEHNKL